MTSAIFRSSRGARYERDAIASEKSTNDKKYTHRRNHPLRS